MCGRYMLHSDIEEILRHYGITKGWGNYTWPMEVFPSHKVPVVVNTGERERVPMKWGFPSP